MPPLLRALLAWPRPPFMLSAPLFFNTENRIFSRACSLACKYAKIRNV